MATSSSYDFNLSAQQIVDSAHRKLGVLGLGQSMTATQLTNGLQALNVRIKQYPALIKKIWGVTRTVTALQSPTIWEDSADATKYWEAILPHTTATANRPTSGDEYIAYYKSTTTAGTTWSSGQSAVSKSVYTVDKYIVDIDNVKVILESNRNENDLTPLSRNDFNSSKINKTTEGTPTKFYFERLNTSSTSYIHLYPSPSDVSGVIVYDAVKYPQDIDNKLNDIDFPQEWFAVLIYGVAKDIAHEFSSVTAKKREEINLEYAQALRNAFSLDEESTDSFIKPR